MSLPNLTNNIIHSQNVVITNQVPLAQGLMQNINNSNGISIATALGHGQVPQAALDQSAGDIKTGMMVETMPIATGSNILSVPIPVPVQTTTPSTTVASSMRAAPVSQLEQQVKIVYTNIAVLLKGTSTAM